MTGAINWDALVAWLALSAAASALLAWQYKADPGKTRGWLGGSAISLELLAAGLAVHWALNNAEGAFCALFIAGVIGLAVAKATLLPAVITASRRGQYGAATIASITTIGAYATVYLLGAMSGLENDSQRTAEAIANSAPLQAIDAEIASTRERLAALAGFADASKAHAEESAQQAAAADFDVRQRQLQADLAAARATLAGCNPSHKTRCINPANAEIARLESLLSGAGGVAPSGGYAARHSEYLGVQQHLTTLENRRAELLTTDSTAATGLAVGVSERMIAWLTGLSEERARALKWLMLVAIFDFLSLGLRLTAELTHGGESHTDKAARRFRALLSGGFEPAQAGAMLAGGIPPAQTVPALDVGGRITGDGLAHVHAGEIVLNPAATAALDKLHPGLADQLNARGRPGAPSGIAYSPQSVPNGTGTSADGRFEPVPNVTDGRGRNPSGTADAACVTAEIYSAYLSGALSPADGRDRVRTFLRSSGHAVSNNRLGECLAAARAKWASSSK